MARDGYLRGALADGARAFRYRAGVRELLGLPTGSGVRVRFASAAPRADFSYLCRSGDQATQVPVGIQRWLELAADDPVETSRAAVPVGTRSGPIDGPFPGVAERVSSGQPLPMDAAPGDVLVVPGITPRPGASWSAPERAESGRIEADGRPELFAETASESTDVPTAEGGRQTTTMPSGIRPVREAPPGPISIAEPVSSPVAIGQSSPTAVRIRPPVASTPYDDGPLRPRSALDPQPADDRIYSRTRRPAAAGDSALIQPAAAAMPSEAPDGLPIASRMVPGTQGPPTSPPPAARRSLPAPEDEPAADGQGGVRPPRRLTATRAIEAAVENVAEPAAPAATPLPAISPESPRPQRSPSRAGTPLFWERRHLTSPRTWILR